MKSIPLGLRVVLLTAAVWLLFGPLPAFITMFVCVGVTICWLIWRGQTGSGGGGSDGTGGDDGNGNGSGDGGGSDGGGGE